MSLLQKIQAASLEARKNRETDKAALLVTLYSEAAIIGKNDGNRESTDEEVVKVVKKFLSNNHDTMNALIRHGHSVEVLEKEAAILETFLPKQLTEAELSTLIDVFVAQLPERNMKQIGAVMKQLNAGYAGMFDGGLASKLIKAALA
jgi:hypothetical protein